MTAVSPWKDFIAGGVGGTCTVAVGHPLDTIKVRLQTMGSGGNQLKYAGTLDCFMKTIKNEGFFGLYKGMAAPIIGVTPMFAVCFLGYGVGKKLQSTDANTPLTLSQIFNAGMLSGVCTTAIMVPGERIKCLLQIQADSTTKKYAGPWDCAKQLYRAGGIASIYKGLCATMLRDVPGSGIYFAAYEGTKRALTPAGQSPSQLDPLRVMVAGGMSGVVMWSIVIPADVCKSRLQTAPEGTYSGVRQVFAQTIRTEGVSALYRGCTPVMLRAFPANAACFFGYELALRGLNWISPEN